MTKRFEIEANNLTKAQVTKLTEVLERLVYNTERTMEVDLQRLQMTVPTMFDMDANTVYLKVGKGAGHIWISTVKGNERIAVIYYNEVVEQMRRAKKGQSFKAFGYNDLTCYLVRNGVPFFKSAIQARRMKLELGKDHLSLV